MALGLQKPWFCTKVEFSANNGMLDLRVDFERGARFLCPTCGVTTCPVHDTTEKKWRHLNFFQHECYLHARVPRVRCDACGVHLVPVPWARPGSGFTLLFEALVMLLAESLPMNAVSRTVMEFDTKLWRIVQTYVAQARAEQSYDERRVLFATPGKAAALWQKFTRYTLYRHVGTELEPVYSWELGINSYVTDEYPH